MNGLLGYSTNYCGFNTHVGDHFEADKTKKKKKKKLLLKSV